MIKFNSKGTPNHCNCHLVLFWDKILLLLFHTIYSQWQSLCGQFLVILEENNTGGNYHLFIYHYEKSKSYVCSD